MGNAPMCVATVSARSWEACLQRIQKLREWDFGDVAGARQGAGEHGAIIELWKCEVFDDSEDWVPQIKWSGLPATNSPMLSPSTDPSA